MKDNQAINVMEMDPEYGNIELDLYQKHDIKIQQITSMFPEISKEFAGYVL